MSLEPQTTAKVRIHTTKGQIDIELWAKETPINSRHFLQSILNEDFDGCEFDRIIPNFIIQVGEQANGRQIKTFEDEFNSRLRFNRRGLLGAVNSNRKDSNNGKFFITLNDTNELNNKNTLFGKVTGDGIFTALKISEGELNGEVPLYPVKITKCEILIQYFDDLKKEESLDKLQKVPKTNQKKKKPKVKLRLNNEEEEGDDLIDAPIIKMKSAHEIFKKPTDPVKADEKEKEKVLKQEHNQSVSLTKKQNDEKTSTEQPTAVIPDVLKSTTSKPTKASKTEFDDYDENFDNLDEDSDDDIDIFKHALKFSDNPNHLQDKNDDLVIIDANAKRSIHNKSKERDVKKTRTK